MRQITTNVYQFEELSNEAKQKAIEWYRSTSSSESSASEFVIDDAKDIAKLFGLTIDKVYFTGFSNQGDGACFEGSYSYKADARKSVKEYAPNDARLNYIAGRLQDLQAAYGDNLSAKCTHRGHYYHSGCMHVEVGQGYQDYAGEHAEDELTEILRLYADWIYEQLEKAYEYENLDDTIAENIVANEYEFTEDGKRI